MNPNGIFGNEFDTLQVETNKAFDELIGSLHNIQGIPSITDLDICQQLEHAHFCLYINAIRLSQSALRMSQLYRYTYLINNAVTKEIDAENSK
jgi:hypothetical protein